MVVSTDSYSVREYLRSIYWEGDVLVQLRPSGRVFAAIVMRLGATNDDDDSDSDEHCHDGGL